MDCADETKKGRASAGPFFAGGPSASSDKERLG